MKKVLRFLGFLPQIQETNDYNNQFIFIEKDATGNISVEANKNMIDQDVIDLTTQFYREVINPILDKQFKEKQLKRHSEFSVNKLINEIEGITLKQSENG